jgi:hypothetical protein
VKIRPREVVDQAAAQAFLARHGSLRVARLGELVHPLDHPALVAETDGGQLLGMLTYGRHRRDRAEQLPLVTHHPEIADHPGPVGDRARQVREDAAPVVAAQRRWQRRRQAGRQPRSVRELAQQDKPRVRHDARAAAGDFKTT